MEKKSEEGKDKETEAKQLDDEEKEEEEDIFIPQAEYSAVCNGDFLPMICNDFV